MGKRETTQCAEVNTDHLYFRDQKSSSVFLQTGEANQISNQGSRHTYLNRTRGMLLSVSREFITICLYL